LLAINLGAIGLLFLLSRASRLPDPGFLIGLFIGVNFLSGATLIGINLVFSARGKPGFLKPPEFGRLFRYSGIVFWANIIQFFAYRADIWIINFFLGKSQLGIYALSAKLIQLFWLVPVAISTVVFSYSDQMEDPHWLEELQVLLRLLGWASFLGGILLCVFGRPLIMLVFGASFGSAVIPLIIMLPGSLIYIYNIILASYFSGMNRVQINLAGSVLCVVIIVSLDFALIPKWGIDGAALASSLGYGASGIYAMARFRRLHPVRWQDLLSLRRPDLRYLRGFFEKSLESP
ncbi:MAG TPA: polysaccharide biosynthesis C-terminal domain-containing protein, partial [Chitinophagaceae bacterium]|nr:polysaccharide biosynthesis C-terminal domain-containing protein [Chitinophagaceae bacterium]